MTTRNAISNFMAILVLVLFLASCSSSDNNDSPKESGPDTEYPTIDLNKTYPETCSILKRGKTLKAVITVDDNRELGSITLDIHNNFDHHNHSTEIEDCGLDPKKEPENPYKLIQSYEIPEGNDHYVLEQDIDIPADSDPGDYHFMIRVTDKAGWQTLAGLSIKIE